MLNTRHVLNVRYNSWPNDYHIKYTKQLNGIEKYFSEIDIKPEAKIISFPDYCPNTSLYFMNRVGWTAYGNNSDSAAISGFIQKGAEYLFLLDSVVVENEGVDYYLNKKIGQYNNVLIYDLSEYYIQK